jgi:hypothetical protein
MVAWVGGKNWGVSISGGAPTVGWVPLAPREVYVPTYRHTIVYVQKVNITHVHLPPTYREVDKPDRPIIYANQGRPGGIGMMEAKVFEKHEPRGLAVRPAPGVLNQGAALLKLERAAPPQVPSRPSVPVSESPGRRFPGGDKGAPAGEPDEGRFKPHNGRAANETVAPSPAAEPRFRQETNGGLPRESRDRREGGFSRGEATAAPSAQPTQGSQPFQPQQAVRPQPTPAAVETPRPQREAPQPSLDRQERMERRAERNDVVERPERTNRAERREAAEAQMPKPEAPKRVEAEKPPQPQQPKPRGEPDRKPGKQDPRRDGSVN